MTMKRKWWYLLLVMLSLASAEPALAAESVYKVANVSVLAPTAWQTASLTTCEFSSRKGA
jgi:hypothetical protein